MERNVKYYNSDLKIKLILARFDEENKCLLSIREAIRIDKYDLKIPISNWNWWCRKKTEVVNSEPYAGLPIDDKLIYKYVKEHKLIPSNLNFKEFLNSKKKDALNPDTVIREVCKRLNWISPKDIFSVSEMEQTLRYMFSDEEFERTKEKVIKEMLK